MPVQLDETRPCVVVAQLKQVLADALTNGRIEEVEFSAGNGVSRRMRRKFGTLSELRQLISEWETKCAVATGTRPRRFGLRSGGF